MLRRRKKDILKDLPPKNRQRLLTVIRDPTLKQSMMESMTILTQGKGVLASMAKSQGSLPESSGISTTAPINERNAVLKSQSLPENSGTSTAAPINERKAVLNELYCQAGQAKIPVLIEFLNRFIQDPSKGKLCVFVHHTAVMNALIEQSKLSDNDCMCKFIRIDGTTLPKDRQDRAQAFQSDPMFRIAILGITSAGVALTLTACST
jgi:SWI/SNF-related matrix-associated actin-dependent regulator 1 of chromatin subfamily A